MTDLSKTGLARPVLKKRVKAELDLASDMSQNSLNRVYARNS
jgi:hypothetical protein